jgi:hypothetical protein
MIEPNPIPTSTPVTFENVVKFFLTAPVEQADLLLTTGTEIVNHRKTTAVPEPTPATKKTAATRKPRASRKALGTSVKDLAPEPDSLAAALAN